MLAVSNHDPLGPVGRLSGGVVSPSSVHSGSIGVLKPSLLPCVSGLHFPTSSRMVGFAVDGWSVRAEGRLKDPLSSYEECMDDAGFMVREIRLVGNVLESLEVYMRPK